MTREEIEQIIRENIRTNGRGEITARVMAGVLESFVLYTDTQAEDFAELCRQLAAAFNALVVEMEGRFETKAEALEAAMEAFCSDLLNNHFIPWAEGLAGSLSDKMDLTKEAADAAKAAALEAKAASNLAKTAAGDAKDAALDAKDNAALAAEKSTAAKAAIDSAADGIAEALNIIREGNTDEPVIYDDMPVLFFDYDGRIVIGYSVEDFLALEAMPANPEHDGLTAQGWNWGLADAKAYVQKYGVLHVGQMYKPTDGKLHLSIVLSKNLTFSFSAIAGTVDWGDGSATEVVANGGSHTYARAGKYEVTVEGVTSIGSFAFFSKQLLQSVVIPDSVTSIADYAFQECRCLQSIVIPEGVTSIGNWAFNNCRALMAAVIPSGVTSGSERVFQGCYAFQRVSIPNGMTGDLYSCFRECTALRSIVIPESVNALGGSIFLNDYSLLSVIVPDGVTSIGNYAFLSCLGLQLICTPVTPPTLTSDAITAENPVRIFVPDAAVADYKAATNWSAYADMIFPISEKF